MANAETLYDAGLGCLLGACIGDAAGATLEGIGRRPTVSEVERAMNLTGGGCHRVAPGQITDDGELTLCLAQALYKNSKFQIERVARKYHEWTCSRPFDIGTTTRNSLKCHKDETALKQKGYAGVMAEAAELRCMASKANGSLMRISPLGIWGHRASDKQLARFAQSDSKLSHPNSNCLSAVSGYVIAIASLMRNLGGKEEAFVRAKQWIDAEGNEDVKDWLEAAQNNVNEPYYPHAGFVKIGFIHAFRHLLLGSNYVDAIRETLIGGGDTDTNACIVGALVGAACGANAIPDAMKEAVLQCNTQIGRPRPEFLHTTQIPTLVEGLIAV